MNLWHTTLNIVGSVLGGRLNHPRSRIWFTQGIVITFIYIINYSYDSIWKYNQDYIEFFTKCSRLRSSPSWNWFSLPITKHYSKAGQVQSYKGNHFCHCFFPILQNSHSAKISSWFKKLVNDGSTSFKP